MKYLFNGEKSIPVNQLPEQFWTDLSPAQTGTSDNRTDRAAAMSYYETVAWLYRCVELRQIGASRVPWAIVRNQRDVWINSEQEPPPQLSFLNNLRRLIFLTEGALTISPEVFWFRERNRARTLALHWHAPQSVIPQWNQKTGLTGFKRVLGHGQSKLFAPDDYVYFSLPNFLHETQPGRPPAQAAMAAAGVLYNIDVFASNFFRRGAIKMMLLTVPDDTDPDEIKKLEKWWKRIFAGVSKSWQTAAIRADVKPTIVGEGISELNNTDLTTEKKEEIATALGVPHSLVFSNAANFATAQQDDLHFYDKTIIPSLSIIVDTLNEQLLGPLGYIMQLRPDEMSVFQADENMRATSYLAYVNAGMRASIAAQILGIDLPQDVTYDMLDGSVSAPASTPLSVSAQAKSAEMVRFRRWLRKRKNPEPTKFKSDLLTMSDKTAIMAELMGDADDENAPFLEWTKYP